MKETRSVLAVAVIVTASLIAGLTAVAAAPACRGQTATIVGTDSDDVIDGSDSPGTDVIVTLGGDDTILAGGGDDIVCAGAGSDVVNGMKGRDLIATGSGDDTAGGGYDSDEVWLGVGDDVYDGDAGGSVNHLDTIYGGDGRDWIDTNLDSPMTVYGGKGSDRIRAYSRWSDTIRGGGGADTIDVRDFNYYDGVYEQSVDADDVDPGPQPEGTTDECTVNTNDTVRNCEVVHTFDDS